jgi:hypothetical protein
MKTRFLLLVALTAALGLPALSQSSRLSPDDQHDFDKAYNKWVNDTRKNDRDDIAKDIRKMQEIMARNNIAANVPYDQLASTGNGYQRGYQAQLTAQDQQEFDKYYTKWVNDTRKNDRDDIDRDIRKMQDIMAHNHIPPDVPFNQIASTGYTSHGAGYDNGYNNAAAYPQNTPSQIRLSAEDQRDFDRYYSQWIDDTRHMDRDNADRDVRHMQDIMARNNIPPDVAYNQVATPGGYQNNNGSQNNSYNDNSYAGGGTAYGQSRLSPEDQREFDKVYAKFVNDSRKKDDDDLQKDARKLQDIMVRNNIPSNIPYDQIASPNAGYGH